MGKVIGVIPDILSKKEIINTDITKLYRVKNMHERKKKMYDLSPNIYSITWRYRDT